MAGSACPLFLSRLRDWRPLAVSRAAMRRAGTSKALRVSLIGALHVRSDLWAAGAMANAGEAVVRRAPRSRITVRFLRFREDFAEIPLGELLNYRRWTVA